MRKLKAVKIEDGAREVVVKEVSPRMVLDAFADDGGPAAGLAGLAVECCGLGREDLLGLYGSDLERLWAAFKEVNSFFFSIAPSLGLDGLTAELGRNFVRICGEESASLLKRATSAHSTTATPISPTP